jgi:hypothetical protein
MGLAAGGSPKPKPRSLHTMLTAPAFLKMRDFSLKLV